MAPRKAPRSNGPLTSPGRTGSGRTSSGRISRNRHLRGRSPRAEFPPIPPEVNALIRPGHVVTNTELFHLSSLLDPRPARSRSQSAPPAARYPNHRLPPLPALPRQGHVDRPSHDSDSILDRIHAVAKAAYRRARRHPRTTAVAVLGTLAAAFGIYNLTAYARQPPPPALAAFTSLYKGPPTWLYADSPDQMFGLDAPLWPRHIQPRPVTRSLFRRNARLWSPDSLYKHRNPYTLVTPPESQFAAIRRRYDNARQEFYNRPPWDMDQTPNMTLPGDQLPFFQPGCVCNISRALSSAATHAITPAWRQTPVRDLADYCPCSVYQAFGRLWRALTTDSLPPPLTDYYHGSPYLIYTLKLGSDTYRHSLDMSDEELRDAYAKGWLEEPVEYVFTWESPADDYIL